LYKGLGAVVSGIVPKMAIRFSSFELYKSWMADANGVVSTGSVFLGKLAFILKVRSVWFLIDFVYNVSWSCCWYN
jgi:hypothetical protein